MLKIKYQSLKIKILEFAFGKHLHFEICILHFDLSISRSVMRSPASLTFSHRSGVTPYTSSYEFAGSCVFAKQSPEILSLRPNRIALRTMKYQSLKIKILEFAFGEHLYFEICILHFNFSITRSVMRSGRPYPKVTVAFLPSSLRMTHSFP